MQVMIDNYQPWSADKIDLQVDPVYLPCCEERSVMVQVGLALLEDALTPIFVYLWRDERNIFLRRQSELWKFGKTLNYLQLGLTPIFESDTL